MFSKMSATSNGNKRQSKSSDKSKKEESANSPPASSAPVSYIPSKTNLLLLDNKNSFDNIVKGANDRLLVIEFFANWCGPCKMLVNKLEGLANFYNGKILIIKIDVDDFEDIALEHDVSAMPTFMIMKNQKKLEQFSSGNFEILEKALKKYVDATHKNGNDKRVTMETEKEQSKKSGKKT